MRTTRLGEPCHLEPCHLEPCHLEPCHLEPCHLEPCHLEPCHLEPCHREPNHQKKAPPMRVLPRSRAAKIEWFEQRLDKWLADPASIGLTLAQVQALQARVAAARHALDEAERLRNASRSATDGFYHTTADMERDGRALISTIKSFADATDDREVYARSNVPPPGPRSPLGPPGTPRTLRTTLGTRGQIHLRWNADDAAPSTGAYFTIHRRLDDNPDFTLLGTSGDRSFTDSTIPPGTRRATYILFPHRGTLTGEPSIQITVQFGADSAEDRGAMGMAA